LTQQRLRIVFLAHQQEPFCWLNLPRRQARVFALLLLLFVYPAMKAYDNKMVLDLLRDQDNPK
jgi:hypothetical protein